MGLATHLLGGWVFLAVFGTLFLTARWSIVTTWLSQLEKASDLGFLSGVLVVFGSLPLGYVINQIWYVLYSFTIDVHLGIFSKLKPSIMDPSTFTRFSRWRRALANELFLAVYHRRIVKQDHAEFLSWHRNRLAHLHSVGSMATGIMLAVITMLSIDLAEGGVAQLVVNAQLDILIYVVLAVILVILMVNGYRAYTLLVWYNRIAIEVTDRGELWPEQSRFNYLFPSANKAAPKTTSGRPEEED